MRTKHLVPRLPTFSNFGDDNDHGGGGGGGAGGDDLISFLPDSIRALILSFLPTKEAVSTSLLSRQWRYTFASSPCLDFDFSLFLPLRGAKSSFISFVDSTLSLSSSDAPLRRLRLSLAGYSGSEPRVPTWLAAAVARRVEHLELVLPKARSMRLPDSLFSCDSLSSLTLQLCDYPFPLPSPSSLTNLTRFHLASASLLKGTFLRELISCCRNLEELLVEECRVDVFDVVGAPRLKRLGLENCDWMHPIRIRVSDSPRLRTLSYSGRVADEHDFEDLVDLDEVVLDLGKPSKLRESDEECRDCLVKLLGLVGNSRCLLLSPWCIQHLCRAEDLLEIRQDNVKRLELVMASPREGVREIAPLLMSFPSVEDLTISIAFSRLVQWRLAGEQQEVETKGLLRHLKRVRMEYIDRSKSGLELVKFMLKNARSLKKMTIVPLLDGLEHGKFRRKVSKFRRASRDVTIEYCMTNSDI
ncbi:F-box/LRR-repeat protein At4g14103-like [Typha latifolia]|uniref:F-box/LRR-repeat protein At4g14103-like n=1 Tax=Typha latifolia TaxID=4733 RepID=UPI003C30B9A2